MRTKFLDYERLLRIPSVHSENGFDLSADGKRAAFAWNKTGQWEIYVMELDSPGYASQVTGGEGAKLGPRFSPDGKWLLYALDLNGGECYDICLCNLESGAQTNLTPGTSETILPDLAWSPDGDEIAYISDISGRFSTYIHGIEREGGKLAGEAKLVFDRSGPNMEVEWSPDGQYLAVTAESQGQDYATFIVSIKDF